MSTVFVSVGGCVCVSQRITRENSRVTTKYLGSIKYNVPHLVYYLLFLRVNLRFIILILRRGQLKISLSDIHRTCKVRSQRNKCLLSLKYSKSTFSLSLFTFVLSYELSTLPVTCTFPVVVAGRTPTGEESPVEKGYFLVPQEHD